MSYYVLLKVISFCIGLSYLMTKKHPESLVDIKEVEVLSDFPVSDLLLPTLPSFVRPGRTRHASFSL